MHKLQNITLENNLSDLVIAGERPPWTLKILFSISADKSPKKKLGQCQVGTHPFHFLVCVMGNVQAVRILLLVAGDAALSCFPEKKAAVSNTTRYCENKKRLMLLELQYLPLGILCSFPPKLSFRTVSLPHCEDTHQPCSPREMTHGSCL